MTDAHHIAGEIRVTSWRRIRIGKATGKLTCPDGHVLRDTDLVWEHGCLRCKYRRVSGGPECSKLVYLLGGGLVNPQGQPLIILAEVTVQEMDTMTREKMDYERVLRFLGIGFDLEAAA